MSAQSVNGPGAIAWVVLFTFLGSFCVLVGSFIADRIQKQRTTRHINDLIARNDSLIFEEVRRARRDFH